MKITAIVVALLLSRGLSAAAQAPNAQGANGETPLTAAVRSYNLNLVKSLLAHGANPNLGGGEGSKPPLLIAIDLGDVELVKTLIDAGADVKGFLVEATPNVKLMSLLVAAGASANENLGANWSALDSAAGASHTDRAAFDFLQTHGAEITPGTYAAKEALTKAVEMGNLSIAQTLLVRGVSPNFQHAPFTDAPLIVAVLDSDFPDTTLSMIDLLLKHGADVNLPDDMGQTPLNWIACCAGFSRHGPQIAAMLLAHGANVNAVNREGRTPLMAAAANHDAAIVRLLIQHAANVREQDCEGETALIYAASRDRIRLVPEGSASAATIELLAANGANVDGDEGGRALLAAVAKRNAGAAAALLKLGAPANFRLTGAFAPSQNENGFVYFEPFAIAGMKSMRLSALRCAVANGDKNMVQLLLMHGAYSSLLDAASRKALKQLLSQQYAQQQPLHH